MQGGTWALDRARHEPPHSETLPETPSPQYVSFSTRSRHVLIDSRHRRHQDTISNYKVFFGVRDEDNATFGEVIKNVVSVNVTSAEIPRTADNIISGRNTLDVTVLGARRTVTLPHGLYISESAIRTALIDALNLAAADAEEAVQFDVDQTSQNRLRIYCSHAFSIVISDVQSVEQSLAFQLGIVTTTASPAPSTPNDDAGLVDSGTFPFMIEALRFTNLMPRPYVDISVPEVPRIGTKLTNSAVHRVLARIPLGSVPGGSQHYEPNTTQLIRSTFSPITLTHMTIQLTGSDGLPYDSRDTPHTLSLEITYLADPIIEKTPEAPPQPQPVTLVATGTARPQNWLTQNKANVLVFGTAAALTLYVIGRVRSLLQTAARPLGTHIPPARHAPPYRY